MISEGEPWCVLGNEKKCFFEAAPLIHFLSSGISPAVIII